LSCLNQFVDSLAWAGNTLNSAPAWCELCASFYHSIAFQTLMGLPAASLCINRRLYHIASVRAVVITPAEVRFPSIPLILPVLMPLPRNAAQS
ncbi:hypothetical protein C8R44DRAFT_653867, partial [Mycena epipterygia]